MNDSLKNYVQKIEKLPTIPAIAQEVLGLVSNDLTSVKRLESVIENDPAISAKILSVANSAFFGTKVRTKTLDNAIMRIGFDNVKSIALGISLMTVLQNGKSGRTFNYRRVFNHSITTGFVAKQLARHLKLEFQEEILINGMLHDLGYLVLDKFFPEVYREVIVLFDREHSLLDAEKSILGFNHTDIGSWLAERWKLPNPVIDTTLYHHYPSLAKRNRKRVAVTHIADYITTKKMLSPTEKDPDYPFDPASLDTLGMSEKNLSDFDEGISGETYSGEIL